MFAWETLGLESLDVEPVSAAAIFERLDFFFFFCAVPESVVLSAVPSVCSTCSVPDSFSDSDSKAACSGALSGCDSAMLAVILRLSDVDVRFGALVIPFRH